MVEARRILRLNYLRSARKDGQLRFGNGVKDAERMIIANHVAISSHDQSRGLDVGQITQRYMRLISY